MRRCWLLAEPSSSCTARQMPWVMLSVWRGGHRSVFETAERVLCFEGRTWRTLCKEQSGHDSDRLRQGMTRCLKVRIVMYSYSLSLVMFGCRWTFAWFLHVTLNLGGAHSAVQEHPGGLCWWGEVGLGDADSQTVVACRSYRYRESRSMRQYDDLP
jgi:hypothetical protein